MRQKEADARQPISSWQYLNDRQIQITHPGAPYDSGAIFEFIYPAKDPIVAGIGFAATRDVNSFLLFEDRDSAGNPNPLAGKATSKRGCHPQHGKKGKDDDDDDDDDRGRDCDRRLIQRAMMTGVSQSGRFMGDFLWQGFNQDEAGRKIFDGFMRIVGGSRKTWTNYQFAQPGRYSKQHEEHLQPGDQFPFRIQHHSGSVDRQGRWRAREVQAYRNVPEGISPGRGIRDLGRPGLIVADGRRSEEYPKPSAFRVTCVST